MPKRILPRMTRASATKSSQGKGVSSATQQSSSCDSSAPVTPAGMRFSETARRCGSAGGSVPRSSSSRRSRHHARRIKPSCGVRVVETTSAKARSSSHSARRAGRTDSGAVHSAISRGRSSDRSAISDGLHRLDHVARLDQRQLLKVRGIGKRNVLVGHAQHRSVEVVEAFGHCDGDDL